MVFNSDYIMRRSVLKGRGIHGGRRYDAAVDIYGGYDSSKGNEKTGEWNYTMRYGYDVPVSESGGGSYEGALAGRRPGRVNWGGLVELQVSEGDGNTYAV